MKPGTQLGAPAFASDDERDVAVAAPKAIACFDIIKGIDETRTFGSHY